MGGGDEEEGCDKGDGGLESGELHLWLQETGGAGRIEWEVKERLSGRDYVLLCREIVTTIYWPSYGRHGDETL